MCIKKFFGISEEDSHYIINFIGIKIKLKNIFFDRLVHCCCIRNLDYLKKQGTNFPHPVGIVIAKNAKIGKNCTIYQNVTIGAWNDKSPIIGDDVVIYANSVIFGDVKIEDNAVVGAGSVVVDNVPKNAVVAGNPAKIIKYVK